MIFSLSCPLHVSTLQLFYCSSSSSTSVQLNPNNDVTFRTFRRRRKMTKSGHLTTVASSKDDDDAEKSTKLITFLGKGGSGKTTTAVFAAQELHSDGDMSMECFFLFFRLHYAREGLSTCLVTHSQDRTADYLLNRKIGNVPIICSNNLSAARLETTKMLLDPLNRLKQADAHVNMTQGVLEGIVGEELGVLPGMDSIFSAFALERFIGFHGNAAQRKDNDKFDVIIYDSISPEETLRLLGASNAARLYVKYLRSMAEKTDFGRLASPSLLRLVYEAMISSSNGPIFDGKLSSEIWDYIETFLERKSSAFAQPENFGCYIVMNPCSKINVDTAIRYWGCTLQAGAQVSGAFAIASPHFRGEPVESIKKSFSPLPFAFIPNLSMDSPLDWDAIMQNSSSDDARNLLHVSANRTTSNVPLVKYDLPKKSITLFMPGFDKSEIKLYQYRGRSELLVEAGDQRRVIQLPREVQGKVAGAKFIDRNLVITMS